MTISSSPVPSATLSNPNDSMFNARIGTSSPATWVPDIPMESAKRPVLDEPVVDSRYHRQPTPKSRAQADDNEGHVEVPRRLHQGKKNKPRAHHQESRHHHAARAELVYEDPFDWSQRRSLHPR